MKKLISWMLLLAMLGGMVACDTAETPEDTTAAETTTAGTTTVAETEPPLVSGVPEGKTFGGESITVWYTTKSASVAETYLDLAGDSTGDLLDDALYNRNAATEDLLEVKLVYMDTQVTTSQTGPAFEALVMSGDNTYDLFSLIQWNAAQYSYRNMFYNMKDAPYISFDEPWWNYDYMKEMTIGEDKIYCMVGDVHVDSTRCMNAVYYNKSLYEDYFRDGDGMYDVVLEGKWTYDKLREISSQVWKDLDGDGITSPNDQLGYSINNYNNLDGILYACDVRVTARDDKDIPQLVLMTERAVDAIQTSYDVYYSTPGGLGIGAKKYASSNYEEDVLLRTKFSQGSQLFLFGFFYTAEALREMENEYGIIPFPKLDEEQEDYISIAHDIISVMGLPVHAKKIEASSAVLETLAFLGYEDVLPVYYESLLKVKYARDAKSAQMIELIRENFITDIAYVYSSSFNSMGYPGRRLIQANQSNLQAWYDSNKSAAQAGMQDLIDQFTKEQG